MTASFPTYLNLTPNAIRSWEQGLRRPQQAALKVLAIAKKTSKAFLLA
jgi:DNA-binding transcriptional regulator YiaG